MAIAIHVGIGIGGNFAYEIEAIFYAVAVENGNEDEKTDHQRVAYEFIADHRVNEEGQKNNGQDLREGDQEHFLQIDRNFVMVIAEASLHDYAAEDYRGNEHC